MGVREVRQFNREQAKVDQEFENRREAVRRKWAPKIVQVRRWAARELAVLDRRQRDRDAAAESTAREAKRQAKADRKFEKLRRKGKIPAGVEGFKPNPKERVDLPPAVGNTPEDSPGPSEEDRDRAELIAEWRDGLHQRGTITGDSDDLAILTPDHDAILTRDEYEALPSAEQDPREQVFTAEQREVIEAALYPPEPVELPDPVSSDSPAPEGATPEAPPPSGPETAPAAPVAPAQRDARKETEPLSDRQVQAIVDAAGTVSEEEKALRRRRWLTIAPLLARLEADAKAAVEEAEQRDDPEDPETVHVDHIRKMRDFVRLIDRLDAHLTSTLALDSLNATSRHYCQRLRAWVEANAPDEARGGLLATIEQINAYFLT